jgi:hypothetical protein
MNDKYIVVTKVEDRELAKTLGTTDIFTIREFSKIDHAYKFWLSNMNSYIARKVNAEVRET